MDIEERKKRLDDAADGAGRARVTWYGESGETCARCGVQAPANYLLALPNSDVSGCLRCLELQAHLYLGGLDSVPDDLAGTVDQANALRQVAEAFRAHVRAAERGRPPPQRSPSRWAANSGWEYTAAWEPPGEENSRWPSRPMKSKAQAQKTPRSRPPARPAPAEPPPAGPAEVLGLTGQPSRAEILTAFRRSALICHPDYGGTAEAFRAIVAARDALLGDQD